MHNFCLHKFKVLNSFHKSYFASLDINNFTSIHSLVVDNCLLGGNTLLEICFTEVDIR